MTAVSENRELYRLIHRNTNIPSPPAIAMEILNVIQNDESSLGDLGNVISADPALTGKILCLANSAFYSLPCEVTNIQRALTILGTNVVKNIALSFVFVDQIRGDRSSSFDFNYFWRRSVTAGIAAEILIGLLPNDYEDIFVSALLQDIGVLMLYLSKGHEYAELLNKYKMKGSGSLLCAEREKYSFDHQQLAYLLLKEWGLPASITMPVQFHHEPEIAPKGDQQGARILEAANLLSGIYSGADSGEKVRKLYSVMANDFNISSDATRKLLDDVAYKCTDVLQIFEIESEKIKPYSQMLQEANEELGKIHLSYEQLVLELKESKERSDRFTSKLQQVNAQLEVMAFKDGLTGLHNHRSFQDLLAKEIDRSRRSGLPFSLILFDIDYFKKVNDIYGHLAGDLVLKNLADAVSKALRSSDIVARYGGEEFAVILPGTNLSGLKVFAERLRRSVAAVSTFFDDNEIKVTISCGGTEFSPEAGTNQQELLELADRRLYASKSNGRNCVTIMDCHAALEKSAATKPPESELSENSIPGDAGGFIQASLS